MLIIGKGVLIAQDEHNTFLSDGGVAIKDNQIVAVGTTKELEDLYPEAKFISAEGKLIMPGFINAHMHFYSTFARGMALKDAPAQNFVQILERLWWRLDKKLTMEDVKYSALVPIVNSIRTGVTTIFDHHASPYAVLGSLQTMAEASKKAGLRACYCYEVSDRDGEEIAKDGILENVAFFKQCAKEKNELLASMFGLHASFTVGNKTLEECSKAKNEFDMGLHVHVAEDLADQKDALEKYRCRVLERFHQYKLLDEKALAVHCIHLDEKEKEILKETKTNVAHNPQSNMGNAVGVAQVADLCSRGINVCMGTDGYTNDILASYKLTGILQRHALQNPSKGWGEPPQMLFKNNACLAEKFFPQKLGKLAKGCAADLILLEYDSPTPLTKDNFYSHLLFGISGMQVTDTMVAGQFLMRNKEILTLDEKEIMAKSRELSQKLWDRF